MGGGVGVGAAFGTGSGAGAGSDGGSCLLGCDSWGFAEAPRFSTKETNHITTLIVIQCQEEHFKSSTSFFYILINQGTPRYGQSIGTRGTLSYTHEILFHQEDKMKSEVKAGSLRSCVNS